MKSKVIDPSSRTEYENWLVKFTKKAYGKRSRNSSNKDSMNYPQLLFPDKVGEPIVVKIHEASGVRESGSDSTVLSLRRGRVIIDIERQAPAEIHVTITPTCDNADVMEYCRRLCEQTLLEWPDARIKMNKPLILNASGQDKGRRGGPIGTPTDEKLRIIRDWVRVQGRVNQEVYAGTHGISSATLRRWLREIRVDGKL